MTLSAVLEMLFICSYIEAAEAENTDTRLSHFDFSVLTWLILIYIVTIYKLLLIFCRI